MACTAIQDIPEPCPAAPPGGGTGRPPGHGATHARSRQQAKRHWVTGKSLLRTVSPTTVRNQYHRLAQGEFTYTYPTPPRGREADKPPSVSFSVVPESQPPTNVHVIIGSNGVGKSRLLNRIANALVGHPCSRDMGTIEFAAGEADRAGGVEVASDDTVMVRDTTNRDGGTLAFSAAARERFLGTIR
jgi:ATPase subunit of ABC transporter with duplicated ATPase domains